MKNILYEKEGKIAIITFNRSKFLNALDLASYKEFSDALISFRDDHELRVCIITGSGNKSFSAGFDLSSFAGETSFHMTLPPLITRGLELWKPVIAAVNGAAFGGGMEILLACDLAVASENAIFGVPEVGWGLIPGWGGTQRLPRTLPKKKAAEMLLMGSTINASEAYQLGLVNKVVPAGELMLVAHQWADKICEKSFEAIKAAKQAMINGVDMSLEAGLSYESLLESELWIGDDAREGVRAFMEKRKPNFK